MTIPAGNVVEKKDEKVEKRKALGRGLASLLPGPRVVVASTEARVPSTAQTSPLVEHTASAEMEATRTGVSAPHEQAITIQGQVVGQHSVMNLAVELIDKNPYQTRYVFDEQMLSELADSIRENGVVQPVVVRPTEDEGRYVLVLGERRLRATKLAGQATIPAIIRRLSNQQAAEMTVLENVQREDLNPVEQAEAFRVLSREFRLTQAQIAERIGVSRETVANYMRLLRLPEDVMKYMLDGRLSFSDARELLALDNEENIRALAKEIVMGRLKWHEIEERVRELNGFVATQQQQEKDHWNKGKARWMDPNVRAAQTDMEQTLGMRVRIKDRNGKGSIVIDYASVDDYERVVAMLRKK
jgi:ParB family transcriptional regulator, chromosome partitioning protein